MSWYMSGVHKLCTVAPNICRCSITELNSRQPSEAYNFDIFGKICRPSGLRVESWERNMALRKEQVALC
jgi:hypothetical protein